MSSKYASRALYGEIVAGPGGYVMPEDMARLVEKRLPELPQKCQDFGFSRISCMPKGIEVEETGRTDISLITTDSVDRDGEVIMPDGADLSQFLKNPVVTFAHNYSALPVGRNIWIKPSKANGVNGLLAKTQYTSKPIDWHGNWFPDAVFHFVKSGDLNGKSLGFIPTDISPPTEDEIKARPEMARVSNVIRKWLLLEYSIAPVPSNPDALAISVGKAKAAGIEIPDVIFDELGIYVPTGVPTLGYKQPVIPNPEVIVVQDDTTVEDEPDVEVKPRKATAEEIRAAISKGIKSIKRNVPNFVKEELDRMLGRV